MISKSIALFTLLQRPSSDARIFVYCIFAVSLVSVTGSTVCDENAETYIIGGETECFCKDGYYGNGTTCTDINECLNSCACSDGLTCINTPGSFECKSPAPVNPCDENAESHIINGTVECFCKDGYFGDGENCSDIDECLNSCACPVGQQCRNKPGYHECIRPAPVNPCDKNAESHTINGTIECFCKDGYFGDGENCTDIDECLNSCACPVGQQCRNKPGYYECVRPAPVNPCDKNAESHTVNGTIECFCKDGYFGDGENCTDINECLNSCACPVGQQCRNKPGYFECVRPAPVNPCDKNAESHTINGTIECFCKDGYFGDGENCSDINECLNSCACPVGQQCRNKPGYFECVRPAPVNPCDKNAESHTINGTIECFCKDGYFGDGGNCSDIDECLNSCACPVGQQCRNKPGYYECIRPAPVNPCDRNAESHIINGTIECFCKKGYFGDGENCSDIDECLNSCACPVGQQCRNRPGYYECIRPAPVNPCDRNAESHIINGTIECFCKKGYYGDGGNCTDINECLNSCACPVGQQCYNRPGYFECIKPRPVNPCDKNAESHIINGTIECFCKQGYYGNGQNCTDINECLNSCACPVGQQCYNRPGYYECIRPKPVNPCDKNAESHIINGTIECFCKRGYYGNGQNCTDINECLNSCACPVGQQCYNRPGYYECIRPKPVNPCDKNAESHIINGTIECFCKRGYYGNGQNCTDINECLNSCACPVGQQCYNRPGYYECIRPKPVNPCDKNAESHIINGTIECFCKRGYYGNGQNCTDINECLNSCACPVGQQCYNRPGYYECIRPKPVNPCDKNAKSYIINGTIECFCKRGYYGNGQNCTDINECLNSCACPVGQQCYNRPGYYECLQTKENECVNGTHNCHKNATCIDTVESFNCSCNPGFSGNGTSCTDINECKYGSHNCDINANCTNTNGSFKCYCKPGYTGDGTYCNDINECKYGSHNCHVNATCTNTDGSFNCSCNPGYTGDGIYCNDINECINGNHNCDINANCTNTDGSFKCYCNPGYTGDGTYCNDINECKYGSHNCHVNATCTNTDGSFNCSCNSGYTGDGIYCNDINECINGSHNCDINANCTNTNGSFKCSCNPGYTGDGLYCNDINECKYGSHNCDVNANCTNTNGSFKCYCNPGYTGDGTYCNDINECKYGSHNCDANANCTNTEGSFKCYCNPGYTGDGTYCKDINECKYGSHNCDINANCTNTEGSFNCSCKTGYTGDGIYCNDVNECKYGSHNCDVNANCTNTDGSFNCSCNRGYTGDGIYCNDINECKNGSHNCDVNANCTNTDGSFKCYCNPGYTGDGTYCNDINECKNGSHNCDVNANCTNTDGSFKCYCNPGYTGDGTYCNDINECKNGSHNCDVNADCTNTEGSFKCSCNPGYIGDGVQCDDIDECENLCTSPRQTCTNFPGTYRCECSDPRQQPNDDETDCLDAPSAIQCRTRIRNERFIDAYRNRRSIQFLRAARRIAAALRFIFRLVFPRRGFNIIIFNLFESSVGVDYVVSFNETVNMTFAEIQNDLAMQVNVTSGGAFLGDSGLQISNATNTSELIQEFETEDVRACDIGVDNCHSNATCLDVSDSFNCTCNSGYSGNGTSCFDINECDNEGHNCHVNATCINTDGSFDCSCKSGYTGNGTYCDDINECVEGSHDCHVNANCTNTDGSFKCSCSTGYTGNGTYCNDINECVEGSHDCDVNANCTNTDGSFKCSCNAAYTGDGTNCDDINECENGSHNCHVNANCTNTDGSFRCSCKSGYTGNGTYCVDIIECDDGSHNCHVNATCTNTNGSFSCSCNTGYTGDGTNCRDIIECDNGSHNCHVNATCTNTNGSFSCSCNPGYTGDGTNCNDINECVEGSHDCHVNADCTNANGSFRCSCKSGYTGNGTYCVDIDECNAPVDQQCTGTGQNCTNFPGAFRCSCSNPGQHLNEAGTQCVETETAIQGEIRIVNREFIPAYNDTSSVEYFEITEMIINQLILLYRQTTSLSNFEEIRIIRIFQSSVGVEYVVAFNNTLNITNSEIQDELVNALNKTENGTFLGDLQLSTSTNTTELKNSIEITDFDECNQERSPCPENSICMNMDRTFDCICNSGFVKNGSNLCVPRKRNAVDEDDVEDVDAALIAIIVWLSICFLVAIVLIIRALISFRNSRNGNSGDESYGTWGSFNG